MRGPRELAIAPLLRVIVWVDKFAPTRTGATHLNCYRLAHLDEVGNIGGFSVKASHRQSFECRCIKFLTVTRVPGTGQNGHLTVVRVSMGCKLVPCGKLQTNGVGPRLAWIAH